ncbi:predicted protein [Pyrenophora tritici-repentis Pt-1C-BFP]|uniref:Uncharacterized protein n=1 Tax=Pyrenophora tritici-repentis (strain Pt-1C-BFP) TaxID=426418 RepID=B2W5L9_PYRTR|nr:uncharacterized protein PTRG_04919 [Pyrenophora tritici-repentis Pt-1C-BFP]EDU47826.1 predicted protein [Pyrenophora tritici-repentis Pt-1C-BFP]
MRFSTIATAVFAAGVANAQVDSVLSQITSAVGGAPSTLPQPSLDRLCVNSRAPSPAVSDPSISSEAASKASSARSALESKTGSLASSAASATSSPSDGAADSAAIPALGAVGAGLFALAGLL